MSSASSPSCSIVASSPSPTSHNSTNNSLANSNLAQSRSLPPNSLQPQPGLGSQPNETNATAAAAAAAAASSYAFRNAAALNGLHPYATHYEAAAAAAACAQAWANRLEPSVASLGRLDAASAGFQAGLAASQAAAFRRSGKCFSFIESLEHFEIMQCRKQTSGPISRTQ